MRCKDGSPSQPGHRRLTVTNRYRNEAKVPEVRLVGKWLARAGFTGGCRLAVTVEPGRLVLVVTEQPAELPSRGPAAK